MEIQRFKKSKNIPMITVLRLTYLIDDVNKIITPEYHGYDGIGLADIIRDSIDFIDISESPMYKLFTHYKNYLHKGYVIKIYEYTEGHDFEYIAKGIKTNNTLYDVITYFKKYNLDISHDFFKIKNGNMYYPYFSDNPMYYQPSLRGFFNLNSYSHEINSDENLELFLTNKKIKKKFLYLNRVPKPHRSYIFDKIWKYNKNILNNSYWSWNSKGLTNYGFYHESHPVKSIEGNFVVTDDNSSTNFFGKDLIKTSFCSIITESEWNDTNLFLSEKIIKPILYCQPFIVFGSKNYYKMLHKLGFKTFSNYWSEAFDDISAFDHNVEEKGDSIINTVNYINNLELKDLQKIHIDMIDILIHNRNILFSIFNSSHDEFSHLTKYDRVSTFLSTEDKKYHFKIENII